MIFAKAIVVDDEFAFAGSADLDERSLFLNNAIMAAFYTFEVLNTLRDELRRIDGALRCLNQGDQESLGLFLGSPSFYPHPPNVQFFTSTNAWDYSWRKSPVSGVSVCKLGMPSRAFQ